MELSKLPDKELKVMVIKMFTKLGGRMNEHSGNFSKEIENMIKQQTSHRAEKYTRWAQQQNRQRRRMDQ